MVNFPLIISAIGVIVFIFKFEGISRTKEAVTEAKSLANKAKTSFEETRAELSTGTEDRDVENK